MKQSSELERLRHEIRNTTLEIFRLVARRQELASEIGRLKADDDIKIQDQEVEDELRELIHEKSADLAIDERLEKRLLNLLLTHSKKKQLQIVGSSQIGDVRVRKVAVLGAAGNMGKLFTRHLARQGHKLRIYDPDQEGAKAVSKETGGDLRSSLRAAVEGADAVLVAVPFRKTPQVVAEVTRHADEGATIAEISSVKRPVIDVLRRAATAGCSPLSLHPFFGPGARSPVGRRMAVVPIADGEKELDLAKQLFPSAELFTVEAEEHDSAVDLTVGVVYYLNMAFASLLPGLDLTRLRRLGGPFFDTQLLLSRALLNETPHTYTAILEESENLKKLLNELSRKVATWTTDGNFQFDYRRMRDEMGEEGSFARAYEALYGLHEGIDEVP